MKKFSMSLFRNNKIFSKVFVGVILFNLTSKIVSFIKELFITNYIGITPKLDSYFISQNIYNIIINIVFVGISTCVIPLLLKIEKEHSQETQRKIIGKIFAVGILLNIGIAIGILAFSLLYLGRNQITFYSDEFYTIRLVVLLIPYMLFSFINLFYSALLSVRNYFFWSTMSTAVPSLITILLLILKLEIDQIYILVFGLILGSLVVSIILFFQCRKNNLGMIVNLDFAFDLKSFFKESFFMSSANSLTSVNSVIDQSMAFKIGSNNVSFIEYGNKLQSFFSGVIISSLNSVFTPYFSKLAFSNNYRETKKNLLKLALSLFLPAVLFSLVIAINSEYLVKILFMRGKFNFHNVQIVSRVLMYFMVGFPFYIAGILGVRMITSLGENRYLILLSFTNMSMNILFNLFFMSIMGVFGIALSTSFVYIINTIIIYVILFKLISKRTV
jgi:putative peptidoglycan lipid II flippase